METLDDIKAELRRLKPEIESRYPIRLVSIFGSFVRGEQTPDSDIDVLAETVSSRVSLSDIVGAEQHLEKAMRRRVDLRLVDEIKPRILRYVLAEAQSL